MKKTCLNCKWSRWNGPHLGCYYNYQWRDWLPQKLAKVLPLCESGHKPLLTKLGCKWEASGEW